MPDASITREPSTPVTPGRTVIGPGSLIRGEMAFDGAAQIDGRFEGSMSSKLELHIGEGGSCKADLDAPTVIVDGAVEGDITARECLQLNATARVTGDIAAATMVVVQGAVFVGHCRIGPDAVSAAIAASESAASQPARPRSGAARPPAPTVTADLEATLAGLETKLAGLGKSRTAGTAAVE